MPLPLGPQLDAPDFAPFWRGCREHRLLVQRCGNGHLAWPPRPACPVCADLTREWEEVDERGLLYSWTVIHRTNVAALSSLLPFAIGIVALDRHSGIRFVGRCLGSISDLHIGAEMEVVFEPMNEGLTLPVWRPRTLIDEQTRARAAGEIEERMKEVNSEPFRAIRQAWSSPGLVDGYRGIGEAESLERANGGAGHQASARNAAIGGGSLKAELLLERMKCSAGGSRGSAAFRRRERKWHDR